AGTLIVDTADNTANLRATVENLTASTGANVVAVDHSWVTDGPSFGSRNVVRFTEPKVAIAWDSPTRAYVAGNTRFVIERQFDYPVTAIRVDRMATSDLSDYHVLILPEQSGGGYASALGEVGIENLKGWVAKGGVLIGIGNANRFLTDPDVEMLAIRREDAVYDIELEEAPGGEADEASSTVPGRLITEESEYRDLIVPGKGDPDSVAGVLIRADVNPDHWLGAGVAPTLNVLVRGSDVYTPITLDNGVNVARFQGADDLLASGYLWEENRQQIAYKPFVVAQPTGRGLVIGFTQDPNVRAYLDGLNVIFMNAIFRGSAHARPMH
ncbi:MAG: peptidase M14, partial [Woeseiaceae bacterium]|nr:peptidase M14 [Woeseiaceae bacterium]